MTRQPNPDAAPLRPDPADETTPDTVEAVRNAIGNAIFDTVESDVLACALTTSELAIIAQAAIAAMQPVVTDDAAEQRGREAERAKVVAYHGRYPK